MSNVKLISYSSGVDDLTLKELVIYCARVSNPASQEAGDNIDKLWNYLQRNKHWSPFEMANVCIEINTTRAISRQIIRHRSFTFQEFSQRYADPTKELGFTLMECRLQDETNRQSSLETDNEELRRVWVSIQSRVKDVALAEYLKAIKLGIAKEQARGLLPEGLTNSRLYMNGTLRSWFHFCEVRQDLTTQKEHRIIAGQCEDIIKGLIE
jgi:thymidylate synthase (FAD)